LAKGRPQALLADVQVSGANDLRQVLGTVLSRKLTPQTPHLLYRNGPAGGAMAAVVNLIVCLFAARC